MGSAAALIGFRRAATTCWMLAVALGFAAAPGGGARAGEVGLPAPGRGGWRPLAFPKVSRQTVYTPVELDGRLAEQRPPLAAPVAVPSPVSVTRVDVSLGGRLAVSRR